MKAFLKKHLSFIIAFIIFYIVNIFLIMGVDLKDVTNVINIFENPYGKISFIVTTFVSIIVLIAYFFIKRKKDDQDVKIENIFLFVILLVGIFYIIFVPFDAIPDERQHFYRAYTIAEGDIVSKVQDVGYARRRSSTSIN